MPEEDKKDLSDKMESKHMDKAVDLATAKSIQAIVTPKDDEIDPLGIYHPSFPHASSILQEFETTLNDLKGVCQATKKPLSPPMTHFTRVVTRYKRLTPGIRGIRAEQSLESLSRGGAMSRYPDMGPKIDLGDDKSIMPKKTKDLV